MFYLKDEIEDKYQARLDELASRPDSDDPLVEKETLKEVLILWRDVLESFCDRNQVIEVKNG
jgi:hypothetical protein